jgi:mono/diheme cytochrome c family protein
VNHCTTGTTRKVRPGSRAFALTVVATAASFALGDAPPATAPESATTTEVVSQSEGATLFITNCASCHGTLGAGDGELSPSLSVVLQDLRYLAARNDGVFPREFVVKIVDGRTRRAAHGPEDMPVWGTVFARETAATSEDVALVNARIEALADFLQSIQRADLPER